MPNPLTLEVTITMTVDRAEYADMTDEQICETVKNNGRQIEESVWDTVCVRVAPQEVLDALKEAEQCQKS